MRERSERCEGRRRGKIKTVDWHDFMKGENSQKRNASVTACAVAIPAWHVTLHGLLHVPNVILGGYVLVAGVGIVIIGCALAEKYLFMFDHTRTAEMVSGVIGKGLPWAFIGGCLWMLFHTPWI